MRVVHLYLATGTPDVDAATTCADCGFDAVLRFPIYRLSDEGVSVFGHIDTCARCHDERGA